MPGTGDDIPIPSLLRASRAAYRYAVEYALAQADCPQLPRGGVVVVAALANRDVQPTVGVPQGGQGERRERLLDELTRLGVMRQVEGQWEPTDLGRRAGVAVASAISDVDARLTERIGVDGINALRRGLVALCDIRDGYEADT